VVDPRHFLTRTSAAEKTVRNDPTHFRQKSRMTAYRLDIDSKK